jgi:hypothetical protein
MVADAISNVLFNSRVANLIDRLEALAQLARHPISSRMMTIDDFMRALERAWRDVMPGHEAADRDEMQRALRRLLRDQWCGARAVLLS